MRREAAGPLGVGEELCISWAWRAWKRGAREHPDGQAVHGGDRPIGAPLSSLRGIRPFGAEPTDAMCTGAAGKPRACAVRHAMKSMRVAETCSRFHTTVMGPKRMSESTASFLNRPS